MLDGLFNAMKAVWVRDDKLLRLHHAEEELQLEETQPNKRKQRFEMFLPEMEERRGELEENLTE